MSSFSKHSEDENEYWNYYSSLVGKTITDLELINNNLCWRMIFSDGSFCLISIEENIDMPCLRSFEKGDVIKFYIEPNILANPQKENMDEAKK